MEIGCSCTRKGLAPRQKVAACRVLIDFLFAGHNVGFHHGDCLKGDAFLHDVATELEFRTVIHPPENAALRAFRQATTILPPKPYLERNREIVHACEVLLICPDNFAYKVKSGTWYTWKYASGQNKRIFLITPDGHVSVN